MGPSDDVNGFFDPRWSRVAEVFRRNLAEGREVGAAVCVLHRGQPVVDLWGGTADPATGRPWDSTTVGYLASATKALAAVALLLLVDQGLVDLDAPVVRYWPEFGEHGKDRVTVRDLLAHRAGVAALDTPMTVDDLRRVEPICRRIAASRPCWRPGAAHGYHAMTFGYALGEIVRRVAGQSLGAFFRARVAEPLGLDLHIGLPASEAGRVAAVVAPSEEDLLRGMSGDEFADYTKAIQDPGSLLHAATLGATTMTFDDVNAPWAYELEEPSGGGIGSAEGLARLYAALLPREGGEPLLSPGLLEQARSEHSRGLDQVLRMPTRFGLGFMLPCAPLWPPFGADQAFGHPGATGALGFADPEHRLAFGYVPNRMTGQIDGMDGRARALIEAVYEGVREAAGALDGRTA